MVIARGTLKPGASFEIDRLSPGTYWLSAYLPGKTAAERRWGVVNFEIGEDNIDSLDVHLGTGVVVMGRVHMERTEASVDSPALPTHDMRAVLSPVVRAPFVDEKPVPVGAKDGEFRFESVIEDRYMISVEKVPQPYKVSQVRYNGRLCRHGIVDISPGTDVHRLEITLAAATSSLSVAVVDGLHPAAGAIVLAAPEPIDDDTLQYALRRTTANQEGKATIHELLPGVYRVLPYRDGAMWMDDPGLRQRLALRERSRLV